MAVWYSLWTLVIFFPFWYVWTKKNLATLHQGKEEAQICDTRSQRNKSSERFSEVDALKTVD
jgi:hypothetical protein